MLCVGHFQVIFAFIGFGVTLHFFLFVPALRETVRFCCSKKKHADKYGSCFVRPT
jgi:hypothetical protein